MDCEMPGINGIETTKQVNKLIPETPIVGFSSGDNKEKFLEVGACGFIKKTEEVHLFFSVIEEQFSKQKIM
ncbi:MAG: hypothetical protein A2309_08425 [Bacteroidetes bacterium RIFOXYB2_FULL_35_7]|nr:MAG: hypothetical protein A2309_08425 [Bacteroidetes bacterium RIFOXYB2_FULL_35_7]OFY96271.1 MAG: hypothetical protein A2491_13830 [Bacteroidetes bacterium RIFOXYC12_FULL_35_7]